jgi:hypothetical protein
MAGSDLDIILGVVLVALYAFDRFNTPPTNRSSTTAARFYSTGGLYLCVTIGIYFLLLLGFPQLLQQWQPEVVQAIPWAKELSAPFLVALLLTISLPRVPVLAGIDLWIRGKLQRVAAIPFEVRRLSNALAQSPFQVSVDRQEEIRTSMQGSGFQAEDIQFPESAKPQHLWTKLTVLMKSLEDWESHPRFSGFAARFSADLEALRARHKQLTVKAKNCFRLLRDHPCGAGTGEGDDAVAQFQADFVEQTKDLLQGTYHFIGRGVLQCRLTHSARCEQLKALGFQGQVGRVELTLDELVALFLGVTVVLLAGFVFGSSPDRPGSLELFGRAATIGAIYCAAVWWALFPKQRWGCAKRTAGDIRPVACYLLSALLASATALVINLGFKLLMGRDFLTAWEQFSRTWPWAIMTFATTVLAAWLTDDRPSARWPASRLRWLEGLGQAGLMAGTAWVVHALLLESGGRAPALENMLALSAAIGFGIGFLVPTWYRRAPHRREHSPEDGEHGLLRATI